jgi:hypothetical protein
MSKLQNDFTTPEQSKRLLELGLPKNSANLYYNKFGALEAIPEYRNFSEFCDSTDTPCWSVGRLIEILEITFGALWSDYKVLGKSTLIERVLKDFEKLVKHQKINFSKLEE